MKFEIYGLSKEELDQDKWGEKQGAFLGTYNGMEFQSNKYRLKQLEVFDYLQIFVDGRLRFHSPKRFNQNIEKRLNKDYSLLFGDEIQISLL